MTQRPETSPYIWEISEGSTQYGALILATVHVDFSKDIFTTLLCYSIILGGSTKHSSQTKFSIYLRFVMVILQSGIVHALHL